MTLIDRPYALLFLVTVIVFLRYWRRCREAKPRGLAVCLLLLFLVSWPPVAWVASGTLEWWYPAALPPETEAGAIVVLSGWLLPKKEHQPVTYLGFNTYMRTRYAAHLYKKWKPLPILACGGKLAPEGDVSHAKAMKAYLVGEAIPEDAVWIESRSRTTYENALYGAEILREKGIHRIVLVTEAFHMLRSEACFRQQGLEVVPAPCGFRSHEFRLSVGFLSPGYDAIRQNRHVVHEWLGLLWYWIRGRI